MIEHESPDIKKSPDSFLHIWDIADRLLPADKNASAIARDKAGAEILQKELQKLEDDGSVFIVEDLITAMKKHTYGDMGEVVAHAVVNTTILSSFNEDALRALLREAIEDDVSVLQYERESPHYLPKSGDIFPLPPTPSMKLHYRQEMLRELKNPYTFKKSPYAPQL